MSRRADTALRSNHRRLLPAGGARRLRIGAGSQGAGRRYGRGAAFTGNKEIRSSAERRISFKAHVSTGTVNPGKVNDCTAFAPGQEILAPPLSAATFRPPDAEGP